MRKSLSSFDSKLDATPSRNNALVILKRGTYTSNTCVILSREQYSNSLSHTLLYSDILLFDDTKCNTIYIYTLLNVYI